MKIKDEIKICTRYLNKQKNAVAGGVLFALSLTSFANVMRAKKCSVTGHAMHTGDHKAWDYLTIDRIDRTQGYVKGNCAAVCNMVNHIKGCVEDPNNNLTPDDLIKIAKSMSK